MTLEYITLGIYLVMMPLLGVFFAKFNSNMSDFVRGGAQATWWLVGSSVLMASTSAFTFTGNASAAFLGGPSVLIIYTANFTALMICALFLGAWFRQTRAHTTADVVRGRYGPVIEQVYAYTGVLLAPFGAAIQLWALAVFANGVFGIDVWIGIVVIGSVVIAYSTTGGKWAVMATDFVQSVILVSITILVAVLALVKVGGFSGFIEMFSNPELASDFKFVNEPGEFPTDRFTAKWMLAIFCASIFNQISLGSSDRFLAVRDGLEARRAAGLAALLMGVGSILWFIPPMVARHLYGAEIMAQEIDNPANTSYAFIAQKLLPNGLMGIMIAAMFSATMSSMDSGLNRQVGIVANNVVPKLRALFSDNPNPLTPRQEVNLCKIITLAIGGLIMSYSYLFSTAEDLILFDAYFTINSTIGIPIFFPLLVGLWVRKMPRWSYFVIFAFCCIPSVYAIIQDRFYDIDWPVQDRMLAIFVFGFLGTFICMLFWRKASKVDREDNRKFFEQMHTPVDFMKEIGVSKTYPQLILLGRSSLGVGLAFLLFLLVPNPLWGRLAVLFVAAVPIIVGVLLLWGAKVEKRKAAVIAAEAAKLQAAGDGREA